MFICNSRTTGYTVVPIGSIRWIHCGERNLRHAGGSLINHCDRQRKFNGLRKLSFRLSSKIPQSHFGLSSVSPVACHDTCGRSMPLRSLSHSPFCNLFVTGTHSYERPSPTPALTVLRRLRESETAWKLLASLSPPSLTHTPQGPEPRSSYLRDPSAHSSIVRTVVQSRRRLTLFSSIATPLLPGQVTKQIFYAPLASGSIGYSRQDVQLGNVHNRSFSARDRLGSTKFAILNVARSQAPILWR